MISIALYNIKGGVGKTAASVNLAYLAAAEGHRVVTWDLDPQGAASFYFKIETRSKSGFKKLFNRDLDVMETICKTEYGNLFLIPAAFNNRHLDVQLADLKNSKKKFRKLFADLDQSFDYLFLDCPPGIGHLSEAILEAVNVVLMPTIPTTLSIRTYEMTREFFEEHDINPEKLLCFFNMADIRKNLHNDVINSYYKQRHFLRTYIPYLSVVEKMGEHLAPVVSFAPSSYAAQCYQELWVELKENIS